MGTRDRTDGGGIVSSARSVIDRRAVLALVVGLLAGASVVTFVSAGVVTLPILGAVFGRIVGGLGLIAAVVGYRRVGCSDCGSTTGCDCPSERGDRCSAAE